MKCPYHNLEMHYHEPTKLHACVFPKCAYANGVQEKSIDPFAREKLIRAGVLDDQMPSYEEFIGWMQRSPMSWMPALFIKVTELATLKNVFASKEAMIKVCERAIDKAGSYTR